MKRTTGVAIVLAVAAVVAMRYSWLDRAAPAQTGVAKTQAAAPPAPAAPVAAQPRRERVAPPPAEPLPSGEFAQIRTELDRRARDGDDKAALQLARVLTNCRGHRSVSDAELERRIVDGLAHKSNAVMVDGMPVPPEVLLDLARRRRDELDVLCAGTKETDFDADNDRGTALRVLQRTADAGDIDAMLEYATIDYVDLRMASPAWLVDHAEAVRERKQRVAGYLKHLLASGDARVLKAYGDEYLYGRLFPRDVSKAYAYYYAWSRSTAGSGDNPWRARLALQYPESELSPEQIAQARDEGLALLAQCCGGAAEPMP